MLWDEYYDKLGDWATSTAVSRISKLENFGPTDEIIDAINTIGFYDEKGATRLLKKALAAGVRFSGEELDELSFFCDEDILTQAIQLSSHRLTTEDLERLYCSCDDEILKNIAKTQHIQLPEVFTEEAEESLAPHELAEEYDYILNHLASAHNHLLRAYRLSTPVPNGKNRAVVIAKYACLAEAQPHIADALDGWSLLESPYHDRIPLHHIQLNIGNVTMWQNYFFNSFFTNLFVNRRIRDVIKNIEHAIRTLQALRSSL